MDRWHHEHKRLFVLQLNITLFTGVARTFIIDVDICSGPAMRSESDKEIYVHLSLDLTYNLMRSLLEILLSNVQLFQHRLWCSS